ncbi:hypothetical protein F2Q69_00010834 [Brassica cretica]|uniref:DNA-directed RNA polymerase n=1 Tax=Brassica cretica TaxID=69181 RepID=A0A8S9QXV8_BRACR|nr:hypothetical protein F2Q69_00010834 [Brassica cretica]
MIITIICLQEWFPEADKIKDSARQSKQLGELKHSLTLVEDMAQFCKRKYARSSRSGDFGMVKGCFFHGLDPYEEMAHSISAREVIVRSSSGLAEPGTLFKNLMAVLRDIVITNDGTVRNTSSNSIVQFKYEVSSDDNAHHQGPVGVLAATAMSNPAYKAVLDSSPNSNSSWELMKDVLLCKANFQNNVNDRRVILYLNTCGCGKKYCQENAACTVRNKLKRISLKDTAVEFLVEHRKPQAVSEVFGTESCLHGHIHLNKTLLDGWNISVLDIRFNTGGFKGLNRSLNIKAPFTEATLIAPRKCFEKAAEKCPKDSLSSVVGSCSWGKRVDVGTGSQFELLWNKKETGLENDEETDVFSFLQMVRPTKSSDAYISSPGFDVTEEDMAEWAESPERDSALGEAKFEDSAEFQNLLDEGKPSEWGVSKNGSAAAWGSNAKKNLEAEDGAWGSNANKNPGADAASWGSNSNKNPGADTAGWGSNAKKNPEAESDGSAAAWGSNANKNPEAEPDVAAAWGSSAKKNLEAESDAASAWGSNANKNWKAESDAAVAAWGSNANKKPEAESDAAAAWGSIANKKPEAESDAASAWGSNANKNWKAESDAAAWGSNAKKNPGADAAAWGSKDEMNKEETALVALGSWGKRSLETEPCSAAWGKKSLETEPRAGVWGSRNKKSLEEEPSS